MTVIVTDTGFAPDTATEVLDLDPADDIVARWDEIRAAPLVRLAFPGGFADGRSFTRARELRLMGYTGRLRAGPGPIADQYAMARRAGFDEVEITDALARRQPEDQWLFRADWRAHDHQSRLRG